MVWDSRAHRLGRFPKLKLHPSENKRLEVPPLRLFGFEWGNISWGVAQLFVWGKPMTFCCSVASLRTACFTCTMHQHRSTMQRCTLQMFGSTTCNKGPTDNCSFFRCVLLPGSVAWVVNGVYAFHVSDYCCIPSQHCINTHAVPVQFSIRLAVRACA
jgi:hypothetical protein